jgi:hypothetical protein
MRIEIHIKQLVAQIAVPKHQKIKWIVEAALLWHQEINHSRFNNCVCIAKRANGEELLLEESVDVALREGESVYIYLPEDINFINMGR